MTRTSDQNGVDLPLLEAAAFWCFRLADGTMSAEDQAAFENWLAQSAACRRAFDDTARAWRGIDEIRTQQSLLDLRAAALADLGAANRKRWSSPRSLWRPLIAMAASLLVAVLGYGVYSYSAFTTYLTHTGERRLILLDDGSRLSLDADTSVKVRYTHARRELQLVHGRAKFNVAKDSFRPFTVTAGRRIVVATGTEFSVELLARQMHVILYEGLVNVVTPPARQAAGGSLGMALETALVPGRELIANLANDQLRVQPSSLGDTLSWESGFITFADEPLGSAVERINRYTAAKFAIGDAETGHLLVSGVYPTGNTESFVEGITGVLPVRIELRNGVRTFVRNEQPMVAAGNLLRLSAPTDSNFTKMRLS